MLADAFHSCTGTEGPGFEVRTPVWKVAAMTLLLLPLFILWTAMIVLFAVLALESDGSGAIVLWGITFILMASSRYVVLDLVRILIVAATYRVAVSGSAVELRVPGDMAGPASPGYAGRIALNDLVRIRSEVRIVHWMFGYHLKLTVWSGALAGGTRIELGTVRHWPGEAGEALHPEARSPVLRAAAQLARAAGIPVEHDGLVTAPPTRRGRDHGAARPATPEEAAALTRKAAGSARFAGAMTTLAVAVMACGMLLSRCAG